MKERFARMFERWNQRNIEYYQEAFVKLEKENKTTFNFAAAFGFGVWLIFRKMYEWAAVFALVYGGIELILQAFCPRNSLISLTLFAFCFFGFGFFGNTFYYKTVKSRVAKGYAEIKNYNSIDPVWSFVMIGVLMPMVMGVIAGVLVAMGVRSEIIFGLLSTSIQVLFIAIPWARDRGKFRARKSVKPVRISEKSVTKYLEKSDPKHAPAAVGVFIFVTVLCFVVAVLSIKIVEDQITEQVTKIAEEVEKAPNDSKGLKMVADFLLENRASRPSLQE